MSHLFLRWRLLDSHVLGNAGLKTLRILAVGIGIREDDLQFVTVPIVESRAALKTVRCRVHADGRVNDADVGSLRTAIATGGASLSAASQSAAASCKCRVTPRSASRACSRAN